MKLAFSTLAWQDYLHMQQNEPQFLARINELIEECVRHPFSGRGKPEPLKGDLKGWWSRRVTREHRFVYRVSGAGSDQVLEIAQLRFHY